MAIDTFDFQVDQINGTSTLILHDSINTTFVYTRATGSILLETKMAVTMSVVDFIEHSVSLERWLGLVAVHLGTPHKDEYGPDYSVQTTKLRSGPPHLRIKVVVAGADILNAKYLPTTNEIVWAAKDSITLPMGFFIDVYMVAMKSVGTEVERYNK